jgi:hypothetical protein
MLHVFTTRRLAASLVASLVLVAGIAASASHPSTASAAQSARPTALSARTHLAVQGQTTMAGYSRDQFGSAWEDVDQNGCDTRDDILRRDLRRVVYRAGTNGCVVVSGVLADPYTGTTITYVRGRSRVDIDHVVALGDAWRTGAARWAVSKRLALANDPLNLLAVSASANRQKSDADAAAWLPANKTYRCAYVARQLAVKLKYALWATSSERGAMQRVLTNCPTLRLPAGGSRPVNFTTTSDPTPPPVSPPTSTPTTPPPTGTTTIVTPPSDPTPPPVTTTTTGAQHYANCTEARAAGVTPIYRGTPLYDANTGLDRDKDGIACET